MNEIGGYFSLELETLDLTLDLNMAYALNSGRHALEYILRSESHVSKIYLPFYTCEVVLEPLKKLGLEYEFYHINSNLEIEVLPVLKDDELIIANNYFGIKDSYINKLVQIYGEKIIIDNAQAFYHRIEDGNKAFYSPRKFFGVPDGGFAVTPNNKRIELNQDYSSDRAIHLLRRLDSLTRRGYKDFQRAEETFSHEVMKSMSSLTRRILASIDFKTIKEKRRKNFELLNSTLSSCNLLEIPELRSFECPMVYPFLSNNQHLREKMISEGIFVATYWPNVFEWCREDSTEYYLAKHIIPLPIDQRYDAPEMETISKIVKTTKIK